jgi:hypothetical protein
MVHAVTAPAMLAAIEAGAAKLVHTPHDSFLTNEQAKMVADAGIENLSTVGFAVPVFNVFNQNIYGFGTDTNYLPLDGLYQELKTLNLMFSPRDIVKLMGPNTAAFIEMDELGTIAPGKIADLTLVDGDPLKLIFNLMNVAVVVQGGKIVVDHR